MRVCARACVCVRVCARAYLDRCGEASVGQRHRVCVQASLTQEGHPGAHGLDVAHPDHRASHTHQPAEHTGPQCAQRGQRLKVIQPGVQRDDKGHPTLDCESGGCVWF